MEKNKYVKLTPSYMKQFTCIGTDCEDTCCAGWNVTVDKKTYKKYDNVRNHELKPMLDKHIIRNKKNTSDEMYAKIIDKHSSSCPFLNGKGLCTIQLNFGEDFLSNVCHTYPRISNQVDGRWEESAGFSCPEIARLVLLNPNGIEFIEEEYDPNSSRMIIKNSLSTFGEGTLQEHFFSIRMFTISTLQNRNYSVADRLILLGLFYKNLQLLNEEQKFNEIPHLLDKFKHSIGEGYLKETLKSIPSRYEIQMKLVKAVVDERLYMGISRQRYDECFNDFLSGVKFSEDMSSEELVSNYTQCFQEYYSPFMNEREYILENYLVNLVFSNVFPMFGTSSVFDTYSMLVIRYAMIKLHLIGIAGHYQGLSEAHIVKLIQSFSRVMEHNSSYSKRVYELLKDNNYLTMPYMSILIKN